MQISGTMIQNNAVDLVTLADPTNQYSFTNFLHQTGRLEAHIFANFDSVLRKEFERVF